MKRNTYIAMLILVFTSATSAFAQTTTTATTDKFEALFNHIAVHYVDTVDGEALVEEAIVSMLEKLDPHSIYIPAAEVKAMNEPLKGNFDGIGVRFQILRDTILVVNPIPGGPSQKLGIMAGDKIVSVEGENVAGVGIKNSDVMDKLRGKRGTKVNVGILKRNGSDPIDYTITRDKIPIHSIDAAYMATPKIGYIKLNRFSATSHEDFRKEVKNLEAAGMEDMILDLRGNGGGYLRTAINLVDELLGDRKLIVYTEGRNYPKDETFTRRDGLFEEGKLVVLIDQSSASASEILSGAVQDWDRGLIVGRRSFGKGLVQKPINLPDGSAIRLTISRYYTPSGRCIQKSYDEGVEAYRKEKSTRFTAGELFSADSIAFPDSLKFKTNRIGRTVYGGGGIMPDIFVPLDTTFNTDYYRALVRNGVFNTFTLDWVNDNRKDLESNYGEFDTFKEDFKIDHKILEKFQAYAEAEGVEFNKDEYDISKDAIHTRLKAQIAANIWDYPRYYEIINGLSPEYNKAIEVLQDNTFRKMRLADAGK